MLMLGRGEKELGFFYILWHANNFQMYTTEFGRDLSIHLYHACIRFDLA